MAAISPSSKRRRRSLLWREHVDGYIFILPWMIGFFVFVAGPMVASFLISFMDWEIVTPPRWSGFAQYERLFKDRQFYLALYNTAYYVFIGVPLHLLLALLAAMAMNLNLRGIRIYRTLYFIPSITPVVASSLLWLWIFNPEFGLANAFLNQLGLPSLYWLQDPKLAKMAFIIMSFWTIGGQMVILLAGLKGISPALYEAAHIDGAGSWASFWHITLPMLSPAIFFNLILAIIGAFQVFTQSYILTKGGPENATLFYVLYLYRMAFENFRMGYASAMAWVLFLIILLFTFVQFRLSDRWVFYEGAETRIMSTQTTPYSATATTRSRTTRNRWPGLLRSLFWYVLLSIVAIGLIAPLVWLISTSLKEPSDIFTLPPKWIPDPIRWENYPEALTAQPFGRFFVNTVTVTVFATLGTLITSSMAAYGFARLRFPLRSFWFALMISTLMLPNIVTLIPTFILFRLLKWIDTLYPLIVPFWFGGTPFFIFLLRQFFLTIPIELDEAARIDGASNYRIYWQIILPLAKPALATVAIFSIISHWNEFVLPLIYLHSVEKWTMAIGLQGFQGLYATQWNWLMAASTVMVLPLVILFFSAQRYYLEGIHMTGLTGR